MKQNQGQPAHADFLRRRAEQRMKRQRPAPESQQTEADTTRLVHELQVHQIELEMQNEELQQARANVEVLLAQYIDLYDFSPAGYLTFDRQGVIRQVNLTGARLLHVDRSHLLKRRFDLFVAESDRHAFSDFLQKTFASQVKDSCELTLPQEGSLPLAVHIEATPSPDGQQCSAVLLDITERRNTEAAIQRLNAELQNHAAQLEAANKELEAFSYSVSHDLRAPLLSIDGLSKVLAEEYSAGLDDTAKDYLQRVRAATRRMGQLIDDILALSRITRADMLRETVDLSALARHIADELRRRDPQREVHWDIAQGLLAEGDPQLLRIALENLLGNAWKFTSTKLHACILFDQLQDHAERSFLVRDNGAGFDMTYARKLFGAFQRLHATSEFEGTGIGLATVRRIIHRHGGRVWAEAEVDKGASFHFTLQPPQIARG